MKSGRITQRSSTRVGVYKVAPMSFEELDEQVKAGNIRLGLSNIGKRVEEKLRVSVWSIGELAEDLGLTKKQVSNAITVLRDGGVEVSSFSTAEKSNLYAIRGGDDGSSS